MLVVPPTHISQGESPRALRAGQISAGASFMGTGMSSGLFESGISAKVFTGEATIGLGNDFDARVLSSYATMKSEGEEAGFWGSDEHVDYIKVSGFDREVVATTLRVKWNPNRNDGWAMTLGGGIGRGLDQNFWSIEHAQIFGMENRYLIPYLNLKASINGPLNARRVNWDSTKYWNAYSKMPQTSWSFETLLGARIPLADLTSASDRRRANHPFLRGEIGLLSLRDRDSTGLIGATASIALVFPLRQ
jgi:hypothetical protein